MIQFFFFFFLLKKTKKPKKWSRFFIFSFFALGKTKTKKNMAHLFYFFVIRSEKMKNSKNWLGLSIIGTPWNIGFFYSLGHFFLVLQKTSNFACYLLKNDYLKWVFFSKGVNANKYFGKWVTDKQILWWKIENTEKRVSQKRVFLWK